MGDDPSSQGKVTLIVSVHPRLDAVNGPNWFPFDDERLDELIANHHDAREGTLQFRFTTDQRLPSLFGLCQRRQRLLRAAELAGTSLAGTPIVPHASRASIPPGSVSGSATASPPCAVTSASISGR